MAINLDLMRQKLGISKNNGKPQDNTKWRPSEGDQTVRILPTADGDPFKEFHFHYNVGRNPGILCPKKNHGEECPICDFASRLWRDGVQNNDDTAKREAKKLFVRKRYFSPILVRGEETRGVRVWSYGKTAYETLLGYVLDPDYGDITDVNAGRDITVEVIPAKETGKMYDTTTVRVKPVQSALTKKGEDAEGYLENQKNAVELFNKYSFDEMKASLQKYLAPSEEKETVAATEPEKGKVDLDSKIDDLFS